MRPESTSLRRASRVSFGHAWPVFRHPAHLLAGERARRREDGRLHPTGMRHERRQEGRCSTLDQRALSYPSARPANGKFLMTTEDYDLVILGSGEGSKFLAWTHARKGNRVAVIERTYIGGFHSSKVVALARRGAEFGVRSGPVSLTHVEAAVIAHPMLVEGLMVLFSSTPTAVSSRRPS
jgi:hypothetical protein